MDPDTGEILALANYPTFNPNAFNQATDDARRNRVIQDTYEPGSTFKLVTASAAIEEGVLQTSDLIDCAPGFITFPGRKPIRDVHPYGVLSFEDVIVKSSNVGAIKAGLRIGSERLGRYINRFGFGQTLSPDFRGESSGIVWNPSQLNDSGLASVSMGYQISVTPLQMAAAVSSVANGGTLFEPRIVRAFIRNGRREPVRAESAAAHGHRGDRGNAHHHHGGGRRAWHGEGRPDRRLHGRRQDRDGRETGQRPLLEQRLQRVIRRVRALAKTGPVDHRRHRLTARPGHRIWRHRRGADLSSESRKHRLRQLGVPPTINAPSPILAIKGNDNIDKERRETPQASSTGLMPKRWCRGRCPTSVA